MIIYGYLLISHRGYKVKLVVSCIELLGFVKQLEIYYTKALNMLGVQYSSYYEIGRIVYLSHN